MGLWGHTCMHTHTHKHTMHVNGITRGTRLHHEIETVRKQHNNIHDNCLHAIVTVLCTSEHTGGGIVYQ